MTIRHLIEYDIYVQIEPLISAVWFNLYKGEISASIVKSKELYFNDLYSKYKCEVSRGTKLINRKTL